VIEVPVPQPGEHELLLKVEAAGVNRADCMQAAGNYPPPPGASELLGLEVVGTVVKCGLNTSKHAEGARVMSILAGGGYAEYCVVHELVAMACPETWRGGEAATSVELCAIPETWSTAHQLLHLVGKAQENEVVVVHAGASGVGIAACQIAKHFTKAIAIVTCSASKMQAAKDAGAAAVVDRGDGTGWAAAVLEAANKEREARGLPAKTGVEVVLDPVGASYCEQNCEILAMDGRWVVYGLMGGMTAPGPLLGKVLTKRIQILGTTLRARTVEYKAELSDHVSTQIVPLHVSGDFRAPVCKTFKLEEAADALKMMSESQNLGKIVLVP